MIRSQQKDIDELRRQVELLRARVAELADANNAKATENTLLLVRLEELVDALEAE